MSRALAIPMVWLCLGCGCRKAEPARFEPPAQTVALDIADRPWAPEAPPEGWCGEASVQMAALHFGMYAPQALIHRLGKAKTPDLWEQDVPVAMAAMGLEHQSWESPERRERSLQDFLAWVVAQVREGHPVVMGVKLYPTHHPEWEVDHLVLVVGFSPRGLLLAENMDDGLRTREYQQLSAADGLSLVNRANHYWGFAVTGFAGTKVRVALAVDERSEGAQALSVEVRLTGLVAGRDYELSSEGMEGDRRVVAVFQADAPQRTFRETVSAQRATRFRCAPRP